MKLICHRLVLAIITSMLACASSQSFAISETPATESPAIPSPGFQAWQSGPSSVMGQPLAGGLWYPAAVSGPGISKVLAQGPVFHGEPVREDASIRPGRWPLVLVSHGIGGHWQSLSWLEAGLAQQGAVVLAVNHPGSTFGDYDMRRSLDHGSRVRDLQLAMNTVLADPALSSHIDPDRIYVVGFSFGGWTALSIGGLRGDLRAYASYCANSGHRHCRDIARAGIDLLQLDEALWNRSYRDARVKAVAAIDPAFHQGLTQSDAQDMVGSVVLIGLGTGAGRLPDTDFSPGKSDLATILHEAHIEVLAPAMHFSALGLCQPKGAQMLADDGDDPVCTDPPGTDRAALHDHIIQVLARQWHLGTQASSR